MSRRDQIRLTSAEQTAFLHEQRVVVCATNGVRGWPHLMPLWYVVRGDELWAWTFAKSQKVRNLERDSRATLQVEDGERYEELRGVMIEAQTELHRDLDTVSALGAVYLQRTVMGRHVFAVGGNPEASRFSGLRLGRIQIGVYLLSGLTAGLAAFLGASFYGSVSCGDATGYELYVIASAVVGGARLSGGRGSAINAMLGAVLIVLIRQSIRTLHLDQNYEWIIIGSAIVVAVVLDQASARFAARRLASGAR